MQAADELIDIGPDAGTGGGKIVFQGSLKEMNQSENSLTAQYLHQKLEIEVPKDVEMASICKNKRRKRK